MTFKEVHYTISNSHPKLVVKDYFSSTAAQKIQGLFKYFQGPTLFSSTFKGLKFQKHNSSIFKDFSSTMNPGMWLWAVSLSWLEICTHAHFLQWAIWTRKVGHIDLVVLVSDQSSLVDLCAQDYKSLWAGAVIDATQASRHTDSIWPAYMSSSKWSLLQPCGRKWAELINWDFIYKAPEWFCQRLSNSDWCKTITQLDDVTFLFHQTFTLS